MERMDTHSKKRIVSSYDAEICSNKQSKLILNTDNCYIRKIQSVNINRGGFYKMLNNEFHESINDKEQTVTLIKISKLESKTARVFSPKKLGTLSRFERANLLAEENLKLIDEVIRFSQ